MAFSTRPGTVFLSATLLWLLCALWYTSNAGLDVPPLVSLLGGALLLLGVFLVRAFLARRLGPGRPPLSRRDALAWAAFPAAAALALAWAWSGAGLRLRLAASAEALRAQVKAAPDSHESFRDPPVRVGLFWVSEVQAVGLCRRFVTTRVLMDDAGLAFCPVGDPPRLGKDSYRPLGGGWWVWRRSW